MGSISNNLKKEITRVMKEQGVESPNVKDSEAMATALAEALAPIFEDIINSIDSMNTAIPNAFKAVGAGAASVGAAGGSTYTSEVGAKTKNTLAKTKEKVKNL